MMGLTLSRRARWGLVLAFVIGLVLFLPLRTAATMIGLEKQGVSARGISGSLWSGRIVQLAIGDVPIGTVNAGLSPFPLLLGRARIDLWRKTGTPDDIAGALTFGLGGRVGIDDVTGRVPLGTTFAPLPIGSAEFVDVSAYFTGDICGDAEGRVRVAIAGEIPGVNLSQGLTGDVRCEGGALMVPLVSQSGLETLNLRITGDGRYSATMRVRNSDPALAQGLSAAGFTAAGDGFVLKVDGTL
ncbi:type II secretion system protein N [Sphingobium algorifonticola]|uniref:Type II secretion system protein N n=1 Tax=Sphingobium algorifonticola TaxID=2008318 RepID=A0A437J7H3_9SPHN|nr:type II secretion system protein N [Sphingobium algorifonticola]RVT40997.1 type II secretion system protein N [Sphingobium algorifonticola]